MTQTTNLDTIARELAFEISSGDTLPCVYINGYAKIKTALQSYGDECARQMREECLEVMNDFSFVDQEDAMRSVKLPSEKVKS